MYVLNEYANLEQRSAKRQLARFTIQYRFDNNERSATTNNISNKGLAFEDSRPVPIETKIDIELIIPQHPKPLKLKGIVKRVEKVDVTNSFVYGVAFTDIAAEDVSVLEDFVQNISIDIILRTGAKSGASDVHLVAHQPPIMRVEGELTKMGQVPIMPDELKSMLFSIISKKQREDFERTLELDFSYVITEGIRFRGNMHYEKGNVEATFRAISSELKGLHDLGLPQVVADLAKKKSGFILLTGPAGSGKSTTLAALVDVINKERNAMIISIEDPIEYVYKANKSIIKQREVGVDTLSFAAGLKHVLRQDPNVVLVGEMRDLDSISMAITAAETGHLILSTLHTLDTTEAINRIIDVYPQGAQVQVRIQLAACLEAVIAQRLLPSLKGGMVLATEVLIVTPAIRNLIRLGTLTQIYGYIQTGAANNMHTMDDSLENLVKAGHISKETALGYLKDPKRLSSV
jgi:twitching motility protein PilT